MIDSKSAHLIQAEDLVARFLPQHSADAEQRGGPNCGQARSRRKQMLAWHKRKTRHSGCAFPHSLQNVRSETLRQLSAGSWGPQAPQSPEICP